MSWDRDLAALSLSILITLCNRPLFVVFTDAVSAYDRVWKQALYAKLARRHHSLAEVKQLAMLDEWMESVIKNGNEVSSIIGIAQGGAKSAELFCAFMADLMTLEPRALLATSEALSLRA